MFGCIQDGWKPLHAAAESGHAKVAEMLIETQADINVIEEVKNLLFKAASSNQACMYGYYCRMNGLLYMLLWIMVTLLFKHAHQNVNAAKEVKKRYPCGWFFNSMLCIYIGWMDSFTFSWRKW